MNPSWRAVSCGPAEYNQNGLAADNWPRPEVSREASLCRIVDDLIGLAGLDPDECFAYVQDHVPLRSGRLMPSSFSQVSLASHGDASRHGYS